MGWLTIWWVWIAIALLAGIAEILLPSFIFLGFSVGALALAGLLLVAPGLFATISFNALMALFAALSLVGWLGLRYAFRNQSSGAQTFTDDVND